MPFRRREHMTPSASSSCFSQVLFHLRTFVSHSIYIECFVISYFFSVHLLVCSYVRSLVCVVTYTHNFIFINYAAMHQPNQRTATQTKGERKYKMK